ncbi:MAG: 30S ribosomal protein S16 [Patescibacteria group bacterium]|nr:30S ribosomal protein S16 [Patescibacteria group bacterium]
MIKLKRVGKKHQPSFRLIVQEKRTKVNGRPTEDLGSYSTTTKKSAFNNERVKHWLSVGAQPTATVHNLLVSNGIIEGVKIPVNKKSKKSVAENAPAAAKNPAGEAPAEKIPAETSAA